MFLEEKYGFFIVISFLQFYNFYIYRNLIIICKMIEIAANYVFVRL